MWFRKVQLTGALGLLAVPSMACVAIEGDRILAKDLAAADGIFARIDPAAEIGLAPRAGVTRLLESQELAKIARRYGLEESPKFKGVCFIRAAAQPPAMGFGNAAAKGPEVSRGDGVAVEVRSGGAFVAFEAKAESSGRSGDNVLVRNPENGRLFQARVERKGKVVVQK